MPSASKCRKSANLSRIARMVYGPEPVRPYPARMLPTYLQVQLAATVPQGNLKGGKRRGG
jgi:hypothetical protein